MQSDTYRITPVQSNSPISYRVVNVQSAQRRVNVAHSAQRLKLISYSLSAGYYS